jgi:hypothetical protein
MYGGSAYGTTPLGAPGIVRSAPAGVTLRTTPTRSAYTTSASVDFTKPTGLAVGDFISVMFYLGTAKTITAPSGWTQLGSAVAFTGAAAGYQGYKFYKIADGTEASTISFTFTGSTDHTGAIAAYSGVDQTTPLDVTTTSAAGSSTSIDAPTLTPVTANVLLLWSALHWNGTSGSESPSSGFTIEFNEATRDNIIQDKTLATPAATGTVSVTTSTTPWVVWMDALRPASSGAGSFPVSGTVPAVTAAAATVGLSAAVAGTAAVISTAAAAATALLPVAGAAPVVSTAVAAVGARLTAAGVAAATTITSATVGGLLAVAATAPAVSTTSATVGALLVVGGTVPTVTTVSASVGVVSGGFAVSGTVAAVTTVSATAGVASPAAGTVPAVTTAQGAVGGRLAVTGTVPAVTTVQGATTARLTIAGTIAAVTVTAAIVTARLTVSGTVLVLSTVTAAAGSTAVLRDMDLTVVPLQPRFRVDALPSRFAVVSSGPRFTIQPLE